jgi:hypothetical protein
VGARMGWVSSDRVPTTTIAQLHYCSGVRVRRAGVVLAAGAGYLLISVVVWWHLWAIGLGHGITANGFGDPAQDVWFLAWVPHALGHGLNPFVSTAMFAPKGINLVLNASILLPSLVLAPVTELFGPLVAFNVAVVLAPVLSALSAFVAFRRWAPFAPGRWLAGAFYGFSPFVLNDLMAGHLHLTVLVFPPIALVLLDDLLVRQQGRAVVKGGLLGLVFAAQFLTGQEVMAMMAMLVVCGIAILALRHPAEVRRRWRRVAAGLGSAVLVGGALVAYPFYEMVAGPQRFTGTVFPVPYGYIILLRTWLWPLGSWPQFTATTYVGIPVLLVIALGSWRLRNGTLRFAAAMVGVAMLFALGGSVRWTLAVDTHIPLPDRIFSHWPLLKNLLPVRFSILINMFLGLGLAIVVDRVWGGATRAAASTGVTTSRRRTACAGLLAVGIGLVAVVSPVLGSPIPFAVQRITVPAVYRSSLLRDLPAGTILLGYPVPNDFFADPLIWQAEEAMPYDLVAGYGFIPAASGTQPIEKLPPSPAYRVFQDAQVGLLPPTPSAGDVAGVRADFEAWHVSIVVEYAGDASLRQPAQLAAVVDAATGVTPLRVDGAWVWRLRS